MNKIYSKVWNSSLGQWVVASEIASGGSGGVVAGPRTLLPAPGRLGMALGLALAVMAPVGARAADGVYVNGGTDADCVAVHDDASGTVTSVSDAAKCGADDAATQTDRVLFYGDADDNGATSLSLGGELNVNSGRVNLGGGSAGDMMVGDASTLAVGGNATAIGSAAFAGNANALVVGTASMAAGVNTTAVGPAAAAIGDDSTAVGSTSVAVGTQSTSMGFQSNALGDLSTALGGGAFTLGTGATAVGYGTTAAGDYDFVAGYGAGSSGNGYDVVIGYSASSNPLSSNGNVVLGAYAFGGGRAVAVGFNARANGASSIALGFNTETNGAFSTAIGWGSKTGGIGAFAAGYGASASMIGATAINAGASAREATAMGYGASASGTYGVALGSSAIASGQGAVALGGQNIDQGGGVPRATLSFGRHSVALGSGAAAVTDNSVALGGNSLAGRDVDSTTSALHTTAIGGEAWATEDDATVVGYNSYAQALGSTVLGSNAWTTKDATASVALGSGSLADRANTVSVGAAQAWTDAAGVVHAAIDRQITNVAAGTEATDAVNKSQLDATSGRVTVVEGRVDTLEGQITGMGSVVANAVAYDDAGKDTISLGGSAGTRLANVRAGISDTDAVNLGQLSSIAYALGGGAGFNGGAFVAPSFGFGGGSYGSVGATFDAISMSFDGIVGRLSALEASSSGVPVGIGDGLALGNGSVAIDANDTAIGNGATVGADGSTAVGANATITADAANAVAVGADSNVSAAAGTALGQGTTVTAEGAVAIGQGSVADQASTVSVGSVGEERRITNVAAGIAATDAVNLGQMEAGDQAAIAAAQQYTDTTATKTLSQANAYTDSRLSDLTTGFDQLRDDVWSRMGQQDRRIDRQGAMSAAMTNMAMNAANSRSPRGRVAVGAGWQNGESALSVGYSKQVGERASFSLGGSFSGDDRSAGVGFGIDL